MSALVAGRQRSGTQPSLLEGWVSCFFLVFLLLPRKMSPVWLNTHIGNWFIPFFGSSLPLVRSPNRTWAQIGYMSRSRCFPIVWCRAKRETRERLPITNQTRLDSGKTARSPIRLRWNRQLFTNRSERRCQRETCCPTQIRGGDAGCSGWTCSP